MTQIDQRDDVRERILVATAAIVVSDGAEAATTRAIAAAAAVQAPTIYRLFGDKRGLLDAVAHHVLAQHIAQKSARTPHADPVQDLRDGWDDQVAFSLRYPGVFEIMSTAANGSSPLMLAAREVLRRRLQRIAAAGRLRVDEDHAIALMQATCSGVVRELLERPENARDLGLADLARDAVIAAIATIAEAAVVDANDGVRGAALALRATLDDTDVLSHGERALLDELLARIAARAPR